MLLKVDHVTRYRYDRPVRAVVQSHRLTPSVYEGQRVVDWAVTVTEGMPGGVFRDGAGDAVQGWTVLGPLSQIDVTVSGTVETFDLSGILKGHRETAAPECYLRPTAPTRSDKNLAELALTVAGADALATAHGLAAAVTRAIAYKPGVTTAATTAAEALALGEGVCQDHAHALIALARHRGIAARYVSGYLHTESDDAVGEAAHAWAEIHVPGIGWIGFDPANECCPDDRYIRLASGLDAQDAAMIRGIARGAGVESMDVSVQVRDMQSQSQQ